MKKILFPLFLFQINKQENQKLLNSIQTQLPIFYFISMKLSTTKNSKQI